MKVSRVGLFSMALVLAGVIGLGVFWRWNARETVCLNSEEAGAYFRQFDNVQFDPPDAQVMDEVSDPEEFLAQVNRAGQDATPGKLAENAGQPGSPAIVRWQIIRGLLTPRKVAARPLGWCLEPLNRLEKASLIGWVRYALTAQDAWALRKLAAQAELNYGARWDDAGEDVPASIAAGSLDDFVRSHITAQTGCISSAETREGDFGILTGPWQNLDWPDRFTLETYQKNVLFDFARQPEGYFLRGLLVGAEDCCGIGGSPFVKGAFFYPGRRIIRYDAGVEACP